MTTATLASPPMLVLVLVLVLALAPALLLASWIRRYDKRSKNWAQGGGPDGDDGAVAAIDVPRVGLGVGVGLGCLGVGVGVGLGLGLG